MRAESHLGGGGKESLDPNCVTGLVSRAQMSWNSCFLILYRSSNSFLDA